jgi:O-antigen/teichoic acid export membrane protein
MRKLDILKNVGSSWVSLGVNIILGLFLSPFILHRLGDDAFGIWSLIFAITGYYGIFDLGIRSSVIRYVSKLTAVEDREGLARFFNTSLATYTVIGLVATLVTLVGSRFVGSLVHKIPAGFLPTAHWLFLMVGLSVALGFPLGIFAGILEGLERFYLLNVTNVVALLLRAVLTIVALSRGYGLLTVGLITVLLPLLSALARAVIVFRILPIPIGWKYIDRSVFSEMANYSGVTFVIQVAYKLRFKTDVVIIGKFLGSAAITQFSIGGRLVDYASEVVSGLAQVFLPMSSQSDAKGDVARLRKIFVAGNRACALVILPIAAILIILGKSVIEAWVGRKYVAGSYPIMLVLLIPTTLILMQNATPRIIYGMAKHRTLAWVTSIEALANLILSIVLVQRIGVIGDAIGTAVPLSFTALYFTPRYLSRLLGVRVWAFLREAYVLPLALCTPLVAALLAMHRWFPVHRLIPLAAEIFLAMMVYGVGLWWAVQTRRVYEVGDLASPELLAAETTEMAESLTERG